MSVHRFTSSKAGTLYFGYGSNLSPFQMAGRCPSSGTPLAIARLNSWSWLITRRGFANVVPIEPAETIRDTDATTVWGVLYNLTPEDEVALDGCEGWTGQVDGPLSRGPENPILNQRSWKPFEQGKAVYNKLYLSVKIEKWLVADPQAVLGMHESEYQDPIVRSLVYVDEYNVTPGRIMVSYIRRMGRAARECVTLGVPERWVNNMFSQHGIDKDDPDSFTNDIQPGGNHGSLPLRAWEATREQFLRKENPVN